MSRGMRITLTAEQVNAVLHALLLYVSTEQDNAHSAESMEDAQAAEESWTASEVAEATRERIARAWLRDRSRRQGDHGRRF